ncbi:hypothetical protein Mmar10_2165 [Maricaulis maris MCS10]|uniref:Uncharacterized protein n=1 Tax=Maricaulis maris (strain MCS10) TaxID=394221 RepID=Q0AMN0_MARMM|nr:hypothetical protein [Maricaulis maris]ABI66457.1 hypothetical protein Mmar10_2165 [Maricaulis maris MCS10]
MTETALNRYIALFEALERARPKPDSSARPFAASALVRAPAGEGGFNVRALTTRTREIFRILKEESGGWRAPSGTLRWIYAAMMAAQSIDPQRYFAIRNALKDAAKPSGTGSLYAGGTRAALVLSLSSENIDTLIARFFAIKEAIKPPWYRRDMSVTDMFAAAHAAEGATPGEVVARRDQAEAVFAADRVLKGNKHEGARLCALMGTSPHQVVAGFGALREAVRAQRKLRHDHDKSMLVAWSCEGLTAADIPALAEIREALPRQCNGAGGARTRLAQQILVADRPAPPAGSLSALTAVIAAQAAMMAAVIAGSTVATTSAASS